MADTANYPTRKAEEWRYSDVDALQTLDLAAINDWRSVTVAAGETYREFFHLDKTDDVELHRLRVQVGDGARCELFAVNAGSQLGRVEVEVTLGKGAHFEFGGVTLGGEQTTREFVTRTIHAEPEATSNQTIRAVHWGRGVGNFLGRIDVARHAQKTDAAQDFKGLLLERGAAANAVPQLEIFADDVKCAHGATVGQLDEQARFYMAARGLSPEESRKLLVRAFLADAFAALDDEDKQGELLDQALSAVGEKL
ncbi:SufD family Fe-S cluster assembly protein [Altericroceibacterium endophyticum]|uniref:SufD family Fe-S cluster assembly protein n=1 Tax=Altericroceibacterium endophyticum TaxID=1808508 RepID=A0A6I4T3W4_9SPHN|nr:SufD family Fe-S cluster assembly protein [Altericroceibacterium endophyticum]MXO65597.1 SufD family Fe-S cluster assembly protein [Altericroceibacterium endophyticum]